MTAYRHLLRLGLVLAVMVIGLGAYVRLSDAGLGCPDWPGCYGQLLGVPENAADPARATKEMLHRYLAGSLGLVTFGLCALSWRHRAQLSPALPTALVGIIAGQALLGMWTVTLLLKPLVVSAHLLGGMGTLAVLVCLQLRQSPIIAPPATTPAIQRWAKVALFCTLLQIALGAWVSSNYATLACSDFPTCAGVWLPSMDFPQAFELQRRLGETSSGQPLSLAALTAIHFTHRLGALLVLLVIGTLACQLLRQSGWQRWGRLLTLALLIQLALGIANVTLVRPLPVALAHNLVAAWLLAITVILNVRLQAAGHKAPSNLAQPLSSVHQS